MRQAQFLRKCPNIEIAYQPGKSNPRADALLRMHWDMPANTSDERLSRRFLQVFKPATTEVDTVTVKITSIQGSGRLAFCSATDTDLADDEAFKIFSYYTAIVVWGNPVHAPSPLS
jgi:hypothetical protein